MANAQVQQVDPIDSEFEQARDRYAFDFDGALNEGYSKPEIIDYVRSNSPEKLWYRTKERVRNARTREGRDVWDVIAQAPERAYEKTPAGIAMKAGGALIDKVFPSANEPLLGPSDNPNARRNRIVQSAEDINPALGGAVESVAENVEGLTTPKSLATAGAFLIPGVNVAAGAALLPDMLSGAWQGGVRGIESLVQGDYKNAAKNASNALIAGLMSKALIKHGSSRYKKNEAKAAEVAERAKVAREVEAKKALDLELTAKGEEMAAPIEADIARTMDPKAMLARRETIAAARNRNVPEFETVNPEPNILNASGRPMSEVVNRPVDITVEKGPNLTGREIVPGTKPVAAPMEMPIDHVPRRVLINEGRGAGLNEADIVQLVEKGALPESMRPLPKERPLLNDTPIDDIIKRSGGASIESQIAGGGSGGELARIREQGGSVRVGKRAKAGDRFRSEDYMRERVAEELGDKFETTRDLMDAWENELKNKSEGKMVPVNDAAAKIYEEQVRGLPEDWEARVASEIESTKTSDLLRETGALRRLKSERGSTSGRLLSQEEIVRQRLAERELARRGASKVEEVAAAGIGSQPAIQQPRQAPAPGSNIAPNPLRKTPNVIEAMRKDGVNMSEGGQYERAHSAVAESKDIGNVNMTDVHRGFEQLKKQKGILGEIAEDAHQKFYDAEKGFAHKATAEFENIKAQLDRVGIKRNKKMQRAVQEFGEKRKSYEQLVNELGEKKAKQVVEADKVYREIYDRAIREINEVRAETGESVIEPRQDYFRHMSELGSGENLISGMRDALGKFIGDMKSEPQAGKGGGLASILKKRTGDRTQINAFEGMMDYIPQWAWETNYKPVAKYLRGTLRDLDAITAHSGEGGPLSGTKTFYRDVMNSLNREKPAIDQAVEGVVARHGKPALKLYNFGKKLSAVIAKNRVASLSPVVTNKLAYANAIAEAGYQDLARAVMRTFKEMGRKKTKSSSQGYFVPERFLDKKFRRASTKFGKKFAPLTEVFETLDNIDVNFFWNAMFEKGKRLGKADPVKFADIETGKVVGARSMVDRAPFYQSQFGRAAAPFTLEVNNFYRQMKGYLKGKHGGTEASNAQAALKLTKLFVAQHVINSIIEEITGWRPGFDPIEAVLDSVDSVREGKYGEAFGRITAEALNAHPFSAAGAQVIPEKYRRKMWGKDDPGRFGIIQTQPIEDIGKLVDNAGGKSGKAKAKRNKAALDLATTLTPWGPGAQIRKTLQGASALAHGLKVRVGDKVVKIDETTPELMRLMFLGPYATKSVRKSFEK